MSASNHYDQNLLGAAPEATKAQLQEGYNVDLLSQGHPGQGGKKSPPTLTPRSSDVEAAMQPFKENFVAAGGLGASHTPFLRSAKGKIIILIAIIVVIGAVVGGAVGGTVGKHNNSTTDVAVNNGLTTNPSATTNPAGSTTNSGATANPVGSDTTTHLIPLPTPSQSANEGGGPSR